MTVRVDLNISLDGYATTEGGTPGNPMGDDWTKLTAAYAATRTFRERVFHDTSGAGTTGAGAGVGAGVAPAVGAGAGVAAARVGGSASPPPQALSRKKAAMVAADSWSGLWCWLMTGLSIRSRVNRASAHGRLTAEGVAWLAAPGRSRTSWVGTASM